MKKQTAYIFAAFIVVLIILAIVIMWLTGGIGGDKPDPGDRDERSAPDAVCHPDCHAAAHRGSSDRDPGSDGDACSGSHSRSAERHGHRLRRV